MSSATCLGQPCELESGCAGISSLSGTEVDVHTPHWHGGVVQVDGRTYVDVLDLMPATAKVADMRVDNPGTWLFHCHVADHMMAGMYATYSVAPASDFLSAR